MRIAIVDDDLSSGKRMETIVKQFLNLKQEMVPVLVYHSPMELLFDLDQGKYYDLFFLDMEMPKLNGLQTAREIRKKYSDPIIIYITDYVEYSVEAFEVNTFRYIPKKYLNERLTEALEAAWVCMQEKNQKCYVICHYLDTEVIPYQDICGMKKTGKYVTIYCGKTEKTVRKTLKDVLRELNSEDFFEVSKGYAVNIRHVNSLEAREVHLKNGLVFPVGRAYTELLRERIMEYWMEKD